MPFVFLISIVVAAWAAYGEEAAPSIIQVKPVVEIDGSHSDIMLSDLVVVHGISRTALELLQSVRLADAPHAGETRSFSDFGITDTFQPFLAQVAQKTGEKFSLRVPTRVVVSRRRMRFQGKDVEEKLVKEFSQLCTDCHFEITNLSVPQISETDDASTWQLRTHQELPKGSFSIPMEVIAHDGHQKTYWVTGVLTVRKRVPVISRMINAGERLQPEDFSLQEKDITFATDGVAGEAEIKSSIAARGIAAGQIIWRSSLRRELAVKNGDVVKVTAGNSDWQISTDGVAQTSGYIGDLVRVKIAKTQKMVSGLLTERGQVEVRE